MNTTHLPTSAWRRSSRNEREQAAELVREGAEVLCGRGGLLPECTRGPKAYILRHGYISDDREESALIAMENAEPGSVRVYYRGIHVTHLCSRMMKPCKTNTGVFLNIWMWNARIDYCSADFSCA